MAMPKPCRRCAEVVPRRRRGLRRSGAAAGELSETTQIARVDRIDDLSLCQHASRSDEARQRLQRLTAASRRAIAAVKRVTRSDKPFRNPLGITRYREGDSTPAAGALRKRRIRSWKAAAAARVFARFSTIPDRRQAVRIKGAGCPWARCR
jgi:hypothetical protein